MGGQTAARLFRLLPLHMPLESKYRLIENLWNHVGARTRKTLRIGLDASIEQVMEAVRKHLEEVVVPHRIPSALEGRFDWLAAGDAQLKQDLLNHVRQHMEKNLVAEGARLQLPIMQDHLRADAGRQTLRLAQILKLGNHELEILIDKNASGVAVVEPYVRLQSAINRAANTVTGQGASLKWLWWAAGAAAVVFLYLYAHPRTPIYPPDATYQPSSKPTYKPSANATYQPSTNPTYEPSAHARGLRSDDRVSKPSQPSASAVAGQSDTFDDHGPGRVHCDVAWSQLHKQDSQIPSLGYRDFIRDCMMTGPH
jgi:hypothetical protein